MMSITPDAFSTMGKNRRNREKAPRNQSRANFQDRIDTAIDEQKELQGIEPEA